jgi:hypothetical protein
MVQWKERFRLFRKMIRITTWRSVEQVMEGSRVIPKRRIEIAVFPEVGIFRRTPVVLMRINRRPVPPGGHTNAGATNFFRNLEGLPPGLGLIMRITCPPKDVQE